jgi:hypothetical protein
MWKMVGDGIDSREAHKASTRAETQGFFRQGFESYVSTATWLSAFTADAHMRVKEQRTGHSR